MGERRIIDFFEKIKPKQLRVVDFFLLELKKKSTTPTERLKLIRLIRCLLQRNS
jgi:hypothetical protein